MAPPREDGSGGGRRAASSGRRSSPGQPVVEAETEGALRPPPHQPTTRLLRVGRRRQFLSSDVHAQTTQPRSYSSPSYRIGDGVVPAHSGRLICCLYFKALEAVVTFPFPCTAPALTMSA
ncbi:unknown protein [Oryza sativa Japonica Group]|uniref:Os01g0238375 protein n=2 Tax=Oryza sativa subsp. japonica TaxID=39947 RepID=C7IWJ4_ORYSJ|nr:hypothetical protein EE612_001348 [Oryza sativa]BAD81479.1 unknown protein [Oryza sativa Japonica Group]BAH90981.1 Os01g0238400 [Oryza sativa Japonica Group]BAS71246.1 Os01g0238375 [Oryza sativa Japonica Group]|eukprot:NP_001172251.1 Os01g0238400 [Oryza sativa Japonica Group]